MTTIPQNKELLKHLFELIEGHRPIIKQKRVNYRAVALLFAETPQQIWQSRKG